MLSIRLKFREMHKLYVWIKAKRENLNDRRGALRRFCGFRMKIWLRVSLGASEFGLVVLLVADDLAKI